MKAQITRIAESIAQSQECGADCRFFREIYPLINDSTLTQIARRSASALYGEENLIAQDFRMISEDFGYFRQIAPIFMYHVGIGNSDGTSPGLHNQAFLAPDEAAPVCAELLTRTAITALQEIIG